MNRPLFQVMAGLVAAGVVLGLSSCRSSGSGEEVLSELADMDKETIFERAEALYVEEEYEDAREYFSFVYDTFPNDPLGHKAALRIADTYAMRKDSSSRTEARLRFKDFANRYPNDPDRDYALLMLGHTNTPRKVVPERDLTPLNDALAAYQQLVNLYPDSVHAAEAREHIAALRGSLAEHELLVARFYQRNKRWVGVQWRLEYLKEHFPNFDRMAEVDLMLAGAQLARASGRLDLARFACLRGRRCRLAR